MSNYAKKVKAWYEHGLWTEAMVRNVAAKGKLTSEEVGWILGG